MIPKRVTWFAVGVTAGATGSLYARRKAVATVKKMAPTSVARTAVARAKERGRDVVDAVREGRAAMRAKEAEMRTAEAAISSRPGGPDLLVVGDSVWAVKVGEVDEFRARPGGPGRRSRR